MVSRDEFARVIESFMKEMPGLVITTEPVLRKLPRLGPELDEYIAGLRDPTRSADEVLGTAFGLVDEFVRDTWEHVIDESYRLYADLRGHSSSVSEAAT
jgi:hypothetical protein